MAAAAPILQGYRAPRVCLSEYSPRLEDTTILGEGSCGVVQELASDTFIIPRFLTRIVIKRTKDYFQQSAIIHEAEILEFVGEHPNIIKLLGKVYSIEKKEQIFGLIFEEYTYSLRTYIKELKSRKFTLDDINNLKTQLLIINGIAAGLTFLHSKNVIHRDLKPGNVLLKFDKDNNPIAVICDFNLSSKAAEVSQTINTRGTLGYESPEILIREYIKNYNSELFKISVKTDIFSLAILIFELLTINLANVLFNDEYILNLLKEYFSKISIRTIFLESFTNNKPPKLTNYYKSYTEKINNLAAKPTAETNSAIIRDRKQYLHFFIGISEQLPKIFFTSLKISKLSQTYPCLSSFFAEVTKCFALKPMDRSDAKKIFATTQDILNKLGYDSAEETTTAASSRSAEYRPLGDETTVTYSTESQELQQFNSSYSP
jgi:serine/threonine protein kinase